MLPSQDLVQRFTTTQNIKKLNKKGSQTVFFVTCNCNSLYLIWYSLYAFYQYKNADSAASNIPQDQIFMYFIAYQLPVGTSGLILAAIYAASQSTISTGLNSVATSDIGYSRCHF